MNEVRTISVNTALVNDENKVNAIESPTSLKTNKLNEENKASSIISPSSKNGMFFKEDTSIKQSRKGSLLQQSGTKMPTERRHSSVRLDLLIHCYILYLTYLLTGTLVNTPALNDHK